MEHLVRIVNERDRLVAEWLRKEVGLERLETAAAKLAVASSGKPYISAVCRYLGIRPPSRHYLARAADPTDAHEVGDFYLRVMREALREERTER